MTPLQALRIYGLTTLAVAAVTVGLLPLRSTLTLANAFMIHFLVVVIVAIRGGTGPAIVSAFLGFMSVNFFMTPPYYSLLVADPREVIDLCVFLIVATIAGQLSAHAHRQAEAARQRTQEQEILYRVTYAFNLLTQHDAVYQALISAMKQDMGALHVSILPHDKEQPSQVEPARYFVMQSGDRIYGTVRAIFATPLNPLQVQLVQTCVSLAATAAQRIDLAIQASKSQQFEEADKLKTAILHAVSHDLRTPITIIKTSASNLHTLYDRLTAQERAELVGVIDSETEILNKLVGNLLDMSRLQAGILSLNRRLNSLEELTADVAARMWQITRQERVRLEFPDQMPLVYFDYGLMLQAVTNIVDNVLRYEPPHRQIEILGAVEGRMAQIRIVNHGQTISDEEKRLMMEPFYRGQGGRTGLGLPIAKGIIEAHQGTLVVGDTPGSGATFVVSLPLHGEEAK